MRFTALSALAVAATLVLTMATGASAGECTRLGAVGNGPGKDVATMMSTHGLQNIIESRGLKPSGPIKTTCAPGSFLTECHSSQTACK